MYFNKCTKCGVEFETKNPKRVICPNCLYPDRNPIPLQSYADAIKPAAQEEVEKKEVLPQNEGNSQPRQENYNRGYNQGGYNQGGNQGSYSHGGQGYQNRRPQGGFQNRRPQGGYQGGHQGGHQGGGFRRPQGGFQNNRPQGGGFRRPDNRQGGGGFRRPQGGRPGGFRRPQVKKSLLISREQLAQIEVLYKRLLPLPNPDAHEVIGKEIELEANKVFFGINLIRQKLMLPKLPYPKRKLAVSPDQLMAIQSLYEPLLPLPPIGCHKIIAKQLKIDEWRVHVGIGIIRKQMNLQRWNPDREDAPEEFKNQSQEQPAENP